MPKVLCLGEILIDRIGQSCYAGGAPANVACSLAKLGTSVGFLGCVGHDDLGALLIDVLRQRGVDTAGMQVHSFAPTREVIVALDDDGDRSFVRVVGNADTFLAADALPTELFSSADFLVLGTLCLAAESASRAVGRALKLAEDHYVRVIVDINWRPIFWQQPQTAPKLIQILLAHADFLKVSSEEATWLFGTTNPVTIGQQLPHLEGILVTHGAAGCDYLLAEQIGHCRAFPVDSVDTTGAGDAFLAGFIHQLVQNSWQDLAIAAKAHGFVQYASAVAALTTLGYGAIDPQPDDAQTIRFLEANRSELES